jgi:hypothetical protein
MRLPHRRRRRIDLEALAREVLPRNLEGKDLDSYDVEWYGHDGIEMREGRQLELLRRWASHAELFATLRADPRINTRALGEPQIQNGWYPTPDAEVYAAMIATIRPRQIIEVGGGFSTLVARRTIELLGLETLILVIDPQPRTDVSQAADETIARHVEDLDVERLPLADGLLLFIDSSHVTRTGGDIPYLYNTVVPRLPAGSVVHAHDVFLPFDYAPRYQARLYTEQYVLHALLQHNSRLEVLFATVFMGARHAGDMTRIFGDTVPSRHGGASFWFRVT